MFRTLLGALRRAATRLADPTHAELLRTRRELAAAQAEVRDLRARCEAAAAEGDALDAEMTSLRAKLRKAVPGSRATDTTAELLTMLIYDLKRAEDIADGRGKTITRLRNAIERALAHGGGAALRAALEPPKDPSPDGPGLVTGRP